LMRAKVVSLNGAFPDAAGVAGAAAWASGINQARDMAKARGRMTSK